MLFDDALQKEINEITKPKTFSQFDDIDVEDVEEPSVEDLDAIMAENSSKRLKRGLDAKDYRYYVFRKKAYNGQRKPIISEGNITCPHCGKVFKQKDLFHQDDLENITDDVLYALLKLYDFSSKCQCGQYLYGYYHPQPLPQWLLSALSEIHNPETAPKNSWTQLAFDDIYDANLLYPDAEKTTTPISHVEEVVMEIDENDSSKNLKEQLSQVNVDLETFCTEKLSQFADTYCFKQLSSCKTAAITLLAKKFGILNFARMNNDEKRVSIGLIQTMLQHLSLNDENAKLIVAKILARKQKTLSLAELKSLSFLTDEEAVSFFNEISSLKDIYDELQVLTKKKMDLSKICIWGKSK